MRQVVFTFILFLCCVTGGCARQQPEKNVRVVTSITVTSTHRSQLRTQTFTDEEKMEIILNYLRKLDPYTRTDISPDSFRSDAYEIIVSYSDGNHSVYRQIYDQYFQIPDGTWRKIDPNRGGQLLGILGSMV